MTLSCMAHSSTKKMETSSSETSVDFQRDYSALYNRRTRCMHSNTAYCFGIIISSWNFPRLPAEDIKQKQPNLQRKA
jgi:hypothetical protein